MRLDGHCDLECNNYYVINRGNYWVVREQLRGVDIIFEKYSRFGHRVLEYSKDKFNSIDEAKEYIQKYACCVILK